ncbi:unnamed protein product [Lupinus luteus]|uniref:BAG domain-containing protein n=1 Tax=Lupinus luteus TaxID=3873 RepID=A0AAV1X0I6_LUPLU
MHMNNNYSPFYTTPWPKKKIVSIPVHFVESEMTTNNNKNKNNPAIKIQKVFRGFLVRKNIRRIKAISVELEKIEGKLCDFETMELIKREQKERLKVSESIMNLLLKLDSVRVFSYYSGVRDYRKSIIKKAIALHELVDQIHMVEPTYQNNSAEVDSDIRDSHLMESGKETENKKEVGVIENGSRPVGSAEDRLVESEEDRLVGPMEDALVGYGKDRKGEDKFIGLTEDTIVGSEKDRNRESNKMEGWIDVDEGVGEESVGTSMVEEVEENCLVKEEEGCKEGIGDYENNNKNKEMLERMMEENERMMIMMEQLFERNEMQTKLLTSLSQRVEQLERAYTCDKMRRRKKRKNVGH